MKRAILVLVAAVVVVFACGAFVGVRAEEDKTDYQELYLKSQLEVAALKAVVAEQRDTIGLLKLALQQKNQRDRAVLMGPTKEALAAYRKDKAEAEKAAAADQKAPEKAPAEGE